jgi:hypothetical protein
MMMGDDTDELREYAGARPLEHFSRFGTLNVPHYEDVSSAEDFILGLSLVVSADQGDALDSAVS